MALYVLTWQPTHFWQTPLAITVCVCVHGYFANMHVHVHIHCKAFTVPRHSTKAYIHVHVHVAPCSLMAKLGYVHGFIMAFSLLVSK